jgi:uncharacterized membrane protein
VQQTNDATGGPGHGRSGETARLETFSDGVFAIAATLLVLNLEVPDLPRGEAARELPRAVVALAPSAISYVVSFLVIMAFWMAHRAQFRAIANANRRLSWLNGLFLMVVAFLPFSTGLFDRYPTEPLAIVIYAGSLALARLMLTAIWWYASADPALLREGVTPGEIRFHRLNGLLVSLVFALSIGVAYYFSVWAAVAVWVALFVADQCCCAPSRGPADPGRPEAGQRKGGPALRGQDLTVG